MNNANAVLSPSIAERAAAVLSALEEMSEDGPSFEHDSGYTNWPNHFWKEDDDGNSAD